MGITANGFIKNLRKGIRCVFTIGLALLFCASRGSTSQPNYRICFPSASWFGMSAPAITIDGALSDTGWQRAFRYDFAGGSSPDVVLRGIRDSNNNLFVSIEANNLDVLDTHTLVVLAFDPDGTREHSQRIHIYPVNLNPAEGTGFSVNSFEYWGHGQSTWNGSGAFDTPSGLPTWLGPSNVKVGYHREPNAGPWHWYLEMLIPTRTTSNPSAPPSTSDEVQVPASGPFGLYVDVFRVKTIGGSATLVPSYWPSNAPETGCAVGNCFPDNQTPDFSQWGTSTLDPACGGASVALAPPLYDNVFTNNSPNSKIALNAANTFAAYVQNTSIDASSGTAVGVPAPVTATFTIAPWGLPSLWAPVPTTPLGPGVQVNPTSSTIDATACTGAANNNNPACIAKIGPWTLTSAEQSHYSTTDQAHQCIRVQIAPAPGSNTHVLNDIVQRNMDFGNASKFERIAEISAKGYPLPSSESEQVFDLHVISREEILTNDQIAAENKQPGSQLPPSSKKNGTEVVSQLTWILEGCRHTGYYMTIKKERLEICESVGAFGYVIRHRGKFAVKDWNVQLTGPGLKPIPGRPNAYQILIPQDGVATVTTKAEPEEQSPSGGGSGAKFAVFLDVGAGIPHGTFSNFFNTGFSLNAGLEYIATSRFSAEGIFGYHRFPAQLGNSLDLYQFSANGKFYLTSSGPFRPFINGGIGGYKFSSDSTYFGGNFGGGLLRQFGPYWGLQASYNFHAVNTPGAVTKFSTIQGGLRFVF